MSNGQATIDGIDLERIPQALRCLPQWLVWRYEIRKGKQTKEPYQVNGVLAETDNPETWCPFEFAVDRFEQGGFNGIGFVFSAADDFVGVDLDGCRNPDSGEVAEWAQEVIERLDSYTELSPSQTGFKIFCRGRFPFDSGKNKKRPDFPRMSANKDPGWESYKSGRYFTLTGWAYNGCPSEPQERTEALQWFADKFLPAKTPKPPAGNGQGVNTPTVKTAEAFDVAYWQEQARRYIAKIPPAISGQGGDAATFAVACRLYIDWGFSKDEALPLFREWNATCDPPWEEDELLRKLDYAADETGERGGLRQEHLAWLEEHGRLDNGEPVDLSGILAECEAAGDNGKTEQPNSEKSKQANPEQRKAKPKPLTPWRPFPVDALPEPVGGFVKSAAAAIGCDASYVALPLLVALAAAIGHSRRLFIKHGWHAPAILWGAIVGDSGTSKTPAFRAAMRRVRERQRLALEQYPVERAAFEVAYANWEKDYAAWKHDKHAKDGPPEKPKEPTAARFVVADVTVEALAPLLLDNPRGLLLAVDELAAWLGGFNQYKGGKGSDAAHWLSMHVGDPILVDRRHGNPKTIYVPSAVVSVFGCVQPAILYRALGTEHRESGLAARLLLAFPPRKPKQWSERSVDAALENWLGRVFDSLYALEPEVDEEGRQRPQLVRMSPEAKAVWIAFYNEHAQAQAEQAGELAAVLAKLEEYAARLALVLHLVKAAAQPFQPDAGEVQADTMAEAVRLVGWFKGEAARVYATLGESDEEADRRRLIEWIEARGGVTTARDVGHGPRWLREPGEAERALEALVKEGVGRWEEIPPGPSGGRPSRQFRLTPGTETPMDTEEN